VKMQTSSSAAAGSSQTATVSVISTLNSSKVTTLAGMPDESLPPQQSQTGPVPPPEVVQSDARKTADHAEDISSEVTLTVPAYAWRHGCGPTALGMVIGYYDANGFADLIPGSAATQTSAVSQVIASGGDSGSPNPPGSERHFEDYAQPIDSSPTMLTDNFLTSGRTAHADDSLADFMNTSRSSFNNYYGWSWSNDMGPAFTKYVKKQNPGYMPVYQQYSYSFLSWSLLTSEIDAGHPMVFLVDSTGDGSTDHFVPVIGYRTSPTLQYASWDTWSTSTIRWQNFTGLANGVPWGVWGGWTFRINKVNTVTLRTAVPAPFAQVYQNSADGVMNMVLAQPGGQQTKKMTPSGTYGNYPSVAETPAGNFGYAWSKGRCVDANCNIYIYDIEYLLANKFGDTLRGVSKLTDNSGAAVSTYDMVPVMAAAPDGRIGLMWYRYQIQSVNNVSQYNYNIFFAVLDSTGSLAYGPLNLTNNALWGSSSTPDIPQLYNPKITATADNRFVLAWEKYQSTSSVCSNDCSIDDIYYSVRSTAGSEVKAITQLTNDTIGSTYEAYYYPDLTALTGNRALLTWGRSSDGDIYFVVLDSAGNIVIDKTNLTGDGTSARDYTPDAVQLSDGKIMVGIATWNGSTYVIRFAVLDTNYIRSSGPTLLDNPAGVTGNCYLSVAADHAGNAVLTWTDNDYNSRRNLYYALVNSSGSILTQPMIFRSSQSTSTTLQTNTLGYGSASYSSIPSGVDNAVWPGTSLAGGAPAGSAPIPILYTSKGAAIATGITLTATLGTGLTYRSDTSGILPTVNGQQITWNLPGIAFLDSHQFILRAGVPAGAVIGTRYQVTLTLTANETDANIADNTAHLEIMASKQTFLPLTQR
jgi:hypothetical protein